MLARVVWSLQLELAPCCIHATTRTTDAKDQADKMVLGTLLSMNLRLRSCYKLKFLSTAAHTIQTYPNYITSTPPSLADGNTAVFNLQGKQTVPWHQCQSLTFPLGQRTWTSAYLLLAIAYHSFVSHH